MTSTDVVGTMTNVACDLFAEALAEPDAGDSALLMIPCVADSFLHCVSMSEGEPLTVTIMNRHTGKQETLTGRDATMAMGELKWN